MRLRRLRTKEDVLKYKIYNVPDKHTGNIDEGIPVETFDIYSLDWESIKRDFEERITATIEATNKKPTRLMIEQTMRNVFAKHIKKIFKGKK